MNFQFSHVLFCKGIEEKVRVQLDQIKAKAGCNVLSSSVASDGSSLFIWDEAASAIRKLGTGFQDTIAGEELLCNKDVVQQIKTHLGVAESAVVPEDAEEEDTGIVESGEDLSPVAASFPACNSSLLIENDGFQLFTPELAESGLCFIDVDFGPETSVNYFEITVLTLGEGAVAIGLGNHDVLPVEDEMPGWSSGYGYHSDDGGCFGEGSAEVEFLLSLWEVLLVVVSTPWTRPFSSL